MENIIETLIDQHRVLQNDLSEILKITTNENPNIVEIDKFFKKFLTDLHEHLKIENEIFYPELLLQMEDKKINTLDSIKFIEEMNNIGLVVISFSNKYKDISSIENDFNNFKNELINIISVLNTRIESEESGIYMYWNMYK